MFLNILWSLAGLLVASVVVLATALYFYSTWHFDYWKKRGVPYEKPFPILGNLTFVLRKSILYYFYEISRKHPAAKYVGVFLGWRPALVVQDSELARNVLQNDFDAFQNRSVYSGYGDPLGSLNIFTLNNPTWGEMRRRLTPMFTAARLRQLHDAMDSTAEQLLQRIQRDHVDGNEPVDVKLLFSLFTTDVISSTVFGMRGEALQTTASPLWTITSHMVKTEWTRALEFICIFFMPAVAALLRLQFFSSVATDYVRKLFWSVAKRRQEVGALGQKTVLLDTLLKIQETAAKEGFEVSDDLMIAQATVFILGGFETSNTILTYTLYELAFHPDEQERLYQEIKEADERVGGKLDYETLKGMSYLTMVLHETLRKYPVVHLDRLCSRDYRLDDTLTVARGTPVFVNIAALHYDERRFPEPHAWDPERFATEPPPFSWLPFGHGPRYCIGKQYGMLQESTVVAHLVRRYRLRPAAGLPAPGIRRTDPRSVLTSPAHRVDLIFEPRTLDN